MSIRFVLCAAFIAFAFPSLRAQAPAAPPVVSPEIRADRSVILRFSAPNAKEITVNGEIDGKSHPMTKGADGVWSVMLGPLPPDIYTYSFNVDGVVALDPQNTNTKYGFGNWGPVSVVEVPGDGPQFYDVKPVPHGAVQIVPYNSKALGVARTVWIYTPPGYDRGSDYPVLYLLHGAGDIESGWTMIGRANNILDNLIAEKTAVPMVVVMPLGHTVQSFWTGPAKSVGPDALTAIMNPPPGAASLLPFSHDLLEDVLPLVEANYKVSRSPDNRAIAGLSMGGWHTTNLAFLKPNLFRYVGLMSPAEFTPTDQQYPSFYKDPAAINKQFKLFWIAVGRDDDLVGAGVKTLDETLTRAGIKHTFSLSPGRHEWSVWRHHLADFAPLLFRE